MAELKMTKIRGIEIKKSVGVAFLGTLMIGIIAGIAISNYLLSNNATFSIDVQSDIWPLEVSFTAGGKPAADLRTARTP